MRSLVSLIDAMESGNDWTLNRDSDICLCPSRPACDRSVGRLRGNAVSAPSSQAEWDAFFNALAAKSFVSGIEQARERLKLRKRSAIQMDYEEEAEAQGVTVADLLSMRRQGGSQSR